jgi:hypothetical protein
MLEVIVLVHLIFLIHYQEVVEVVQEQLEQLELQFQAQDQILYTELEELEE